MGNFDNIQVNVNGVADYASTMATYQTVKLKNDNIIDGELILTQDMMNKKNTKYVILWNFILGENITMPKNCLIQFDGGSISNKDENYTITGQNTILIHQQDVKDIIKNVELLGTWQYTGIESTEVDEESLTKEGFMIKVKDEGIEGKHLSDNIVDDEDVHFTDERKIQLKDKDYSPKDYSGLSRVYLRKNIVEGGWHNDITDEGCTISDGVFGKLIQKADFPVFGKRGVQADITINGEVNPESGYTLSITKYNNGTPTEQVSTFGWSSKFGTDLATELPSFFENTYLPFIEEDNYDFAIVKIEKSNGEFTDEDEINFNIKSKDVAKNLLTQDMINKPNTIYHIQYDYDLNGDEITIPAKCILSFEGGSINNGTIVGNYTIIIAEKTQIFDNITIAGDWNNKNSYSEWFNFDGIDDSHNLQNLLNFKGEISLEKEKLYIVGSVQFKTKYIVSDSILKAYSNTTIKGNNATIKLKDNFLVDNGAQIITLENSISYFNIYDVIFDGNSKNNRFGLITDSNNRRAGRFILGMDGNDIIIERCKFLNNAGRSAILLSTTENNINKPTRENVIIRDCIFKNGGAYLSDATINFNQDDFSFLYSTFNNTIVDNCKFIQADLDTVEAVNGIDYATRKSYVLANSANPIDGAPVGFNLWCGGFEIHGNNSICRNSTFIGCYPAIYIAKIDSISTTVENITINNNNFYSRKSITFFHQDGASFKDIVISGNNIEEIGVDYTIGTSTTVYTDAERAKHSAAGDIVEISCYREGSAGVTNYSMPITNLTLQGNKIHGPSSRGIRFETLVNANITDNIIITGLETISLECLWTNSNICICNNTLKSLVPGLYVMNIDFTNVCYDSNTDSVKANNHWALEWLSIFNNSFEVRGYSTFTNAIKGIAQLITNTDVNDVFHRNGGVVRIYNNECINCGLHDGSVGSKYLIDRYTIFIPNTIVGTSDQRPNNAQPGDLFYDTSYDKLLYFTDSLKFPVDYYAPSGSNYRYYPNPFDADGNGKFHQYSGNIPFHNYIAFAKTNNPETDETVVVVDEETLDATFEVKNNTEYPYIKLHSSRVVEGSPRDVGFWFYTLGSVWHEMDGSVVYYNNGNAVSTYIRRTGEYPTDVPDHKFIYNGFRFYCTNLKKTIIYTNNKWVDEQGFTAAISKGTTTQRPTSLMTADDKGYEYYDTTLNMPIYWDGNSRWVDKEGRLAGIHSGDTASRPLNSELTSNDAGYQYFNIETLELQIWVGNTWETVSFANQ